MSIKNTLVTVCMIAGSAIAAAAVTPAFADVDIDVGVAPPPLREEAVPEPRTGYVWSKGYWSWENGNHTWVPGRWIEVHEHAHWVPERWEKRDENHWHFYSGHWEND